MLNQYEDGLYGLSLIIKIITMLKKLDNTSPNNFYSNNGINDNKEEELFEKELKCLELDEENCTRENGCHWDNNSITCNDLSVKFYTSDKMNGEVLELESRKLRYGRH